MKHKHNRLKNTMLANLLAVAGLCAAPTTWAADQVVIMTIGDYAFNPLDGVKYDAENAIKLAKKLGYDTSNAVKLSDRQLTLEGMKKALDNLVSSTKNGDKIFLYYSGHGGSSKRNNSCEQSIVAQDAKQLFSEEISKYLEKLKDKAGNTIVILDSCHSGGLFSDVDPARSIGKNYTTARVKPKAWIAKEGENCSNGVNFVPRSIQSMRSAKGMNNLNNNFVYITAARENEYALDDPNSGGVMTNAILECLNKGIPSKTGIANIEQLTQCAQPYIEKRVQNINASSSKSDKKWLPPHINVFGNKQFSLLNAPVRIAEASSSSSTSSSRIQTSESEAVVAKDALKVVLNGQDARWGLTATPSASEVKLGEKFTIRYAANNPGYVYVWYVGSSGKEFKQIYPINLGDTRYLGANQGYIGKDGGTAQFAVDAPVGENHLLVLLSKTSMDFSKVFSSKVNGVLQANANLANSSNMACAASGGTRDISASEGTSTCTKSTREVSVKENNTASDQFEGYGASLFVVKGID